MIHRPARVGSECVSSKVHSEPKARVIGAHRIVADSSVLGRRTEGAARTLPLAVTPASWIRSVGRWGLPGRACPPGSIAATETVRPRDSDELQSLLLR